MTRPVMPSLDSNSSNKSTKLRSSRLRRKNLSSVRHLLRMTPLLVVCLHWILKGCSTNSTTSPRKVYPSALRDLQLETMDRPWILAPAQPSRHLQLHAFFLTPPQSQTPILSSNNKTPTPTLSHLNVFSIPNKRMCSRPYRLHPLAAPTRPRPLRPM